MDEGKPPLVIARQGHFHVGGRYLETSPDRPMVGQMYVEFQVPHERRFDAPIVFVHGGQQTGLNWTQTADGREGWAPFFLRRGHATYVVDQVGRGRSAWREEFHGPLAPLKTDFAIRRFVAPERFGDWPQAKLHTQWPVGGAPGDAIFDAFIATQAPSMASYARQQELNAQALIALFEKIGPGVLVVHSQAGAFGWIVADQRPDLVRALVAVEPNGPPVRDVANVGEPRWFEDMGRVKISGLCDVQLTWEPPLGAGEALAFEKDAAPDGPDCATCWRQAEPARRLPNLARVPILMLTAQASYHTPYDHCTARFLRQAGVALEHVYLAECGVVGNGHMLMMESNSDDSADVVARWLEKTLSGAA